MGDTPNHKTGEHSTGSDPRAPGRKVPLFQSDPEAEDDVDLASEDSFPASDPPSHTPISHPGKPCPDKGNG